MKHYRLDGKKLVECSLMEWARSMDSPERIMRVTYLNVFLDDYRLADVRVSTVFLGINHGYGEKPLYFETMVFGGVSDSLCVRAPTYDDALANHEHVLNKVCQAHFKAKRLLTKELAVIMPTQEQTLTISKKEAIK